ncbi:unnamed protein product [Nezara viridula]|uniref:Uncharacterized protein n=1 Tax=Nezara viridula TaxID=85310 RepID=A0A9P0HLL5_NEZVI|nr:unnamed protein product [Nezara viridula]
MRTFSASHHTPGDSYHRHELLRKGNIVRRHNGRSRYTEGYYNNHIHYNPNDDTLNSLLRCSDSLRQDLFSPDPPSGERKGPSSRRTLRAASGLLNITETKRNCINPMRYALPPTQNQ